MDSKKEINFKFKFNEITTLRFFVDNRPDAVRDVNKEGYKIQIGGAHFFNSEKEIFGFDILIDVSTNDKKNIKVCELLNRVSFNIKNFKEVFIVKENEITIPDQILSNLFSLALSTSRGVLFEKTKGSILNNFILPPLNVKDFLKSMKSS